MSILIFLTYTGLFYYLPFLLFLLYVDVYIVQLNATYSLLVITLALYTSIPVNIQLTGDNSSLVYKHRLIMHQSIYSLLVITLALYTSID